MKLSEDTKLGLYLFGPVTVIAVLAFVAVVVAAFTYQGPSPSEVVNTPRPACVVGDPPVLVPCP